MKLLKNFFLVKNKSGINKKNNEEFNKKIFSRRGYKNLEIGVY